MYRILSIDGGGCRGVIPAVICAEIERKTGKKMVDIFDMFIGTSTGSIICGALCAGVSAKSISNIYVKEGAKLFTKRSSWLPWNLLRPRYDRKVFVDKLNAIIGKDVVLGMLKKKFIATAFNLCSKKTHFIKSNESKDKSFKLVDVISWSALSAAYYFGKINVPDYEWKYVNPECSVFDVKGAVFQDGGQGGANCTIRQSIVEAIAKNLEPCYILSLGTGCVDLYDTYNEASKEGFVGQLALYPGQARNESTQAQVDEALFIEANRTSIDIDRLNCTIDKKMDALDAIDFIPDFESMGLKLANKVNYNKLM